MTGSTLGSAAIAALLAEYLSNEIIGDGQPVDLKENLLADGLVDSLGMLRLVGFIEATFTIKIAPDQFTIENFRDLEVISGYVQRLVEGGGA